MAFLDSTMSENSFLFTSESVGEVSKSDFEKLTKLPIKSKTLGVNLKSLKRVKKFYYRLIAQ